MKQSLLYYDCLGIAIVLAAVGAGVYSGIDAQRTAGLRLAELRAEHGKASSALAAAQEKLKQTSEQLEGIRRQVTERGSLPVQSETETDLRRISQLAREHAVQLADVSPTSPRVYTGIIEARYHIRAAGAYPALAHWFSALQQEPFWADITRLSLSISTQRKPDDDALRAAEITLSLYSSQSDEAETG